MRFHLRHHNHFLYSKVVLESFNDVRLCPVSNDLQRLDAFDLKISPENASVLRRLDFYLNQVHHVEITEEHTVLEVTAESTVSTFPDSRNLDVESPSAELLGLEQKSEFYDFVTESDYTYFAPAVQQEYRSLTLPGGNVKTDCRVIMSAVFERFHYLPGSTHVESTTEEVVLKRAGVCQDFAHVMIALCRLAKIPARYVSGYFYFEGASTAARDRTTESHAWVECYLPKIGWVGFDPTHNRLIDDNYIKLAIGRDYTDARPLSGAFRGAGAAKLRVSVEIDRLD